MTVKMRQIVLSSVLALMLVFAGVASAQAASVTVKKVVVKVKGVGTYTPTELKNLAITKAMQASLETTKTAATKKIGTKNSGWVRSIEKKSKKRAVDMRYAYKNKKMVIIGASKGHYVTRSSVFNAVMSGLKKAKLDGGTVTVTVTPKLTKAGISKRSKLGKCIVVDLSKRHLWLYNHGKKTKYSYSVTVGKAGHRTPTGTYTIGTKRPRPTWSNPGSAWAKNMPKTIGPGPRNPLGLRAMNLNRNGHDTGLRIHGTANYRQIGTAASHGCIRVANKNIVKLYPQVPKGTLVIVQP